VPEMMALFATCLARGRRPPPTGGRPGDRGADRPGKGGAGRRRAGLRAGPPESACIRGRGSRVFGPGTAGCGGRGARDDEADGVAPGGGSRRRGGSAARPRHGADGRWTPSCSTRSRPRSRWLPSYVLIRTAGRPGPSRVMGPAGLLHRRTCSCRSFLYGPPRSSWRRARRPPSRPRSGASRAARRQAARRRSSAVAPAPVAPVADRAARRPRTARHPAGRPGRGRSGRAGPAQDPDRQRDVAGRGRARVADGRTGRGQRRGDPRRGPGRGARRDLLARLFRDGERLGSPWRSPRAPPSRRSKVSPCRACGEPGAAEGEPLIGRVVRHGPGSFTVELSPDPVDRENNRDRLLGRPWLDIALRLRSGREVVLTLESGRAGAALIRQVVGAPPG
jgi:hypothetical protein